MKNKVVLLFLLIILFCVFRLNDLNNKPIYAKIPHTCEISSACDFNTININVFPMIIEVPIESYSGIRVFPIFHLNIDNKKSLGSKTKYNIASLFTFTDPTNETQPNHIQFGPIEICFSKNFIKDHRSAILAINIHKIFKNRNKRTLCLGFHFCDCGFNYDHSNKKWILDLGAKVSFGVLS